MTHVSDREILQEVANSPIGGRHLMEGVNADNLPYIMSQEAIEAGRRANKIYLPAGKRPTLTPETRERQQQLKDAQIDIEEAIAAAGGQCGSSKRAA